MPPIRRLRDELQTLLQNWRNDLNPLWSAALGAVEPDFAAVDSSLELNPGEIIYPGRKGHPPVGARADSHIFRALDSINPDDVRVVVMGQDPYTHVQQATGRSFEQGDLSDWLGTPPVTPSLRRIIQSLAHFRTGNSSYTANNGWSRVVHDLQAGSLTLPSSMPLWDHWQSQGVIYINAILTFNRFDPAFQFGGHQPLWAPIIKQLLKALVERPGKSLICVGWGSKAQSALTRAGVKAAAIAAGTWENKVRIVNGPHPNAPPPNSPPFLTGPNRLQEINDAIVATGGATVNW